MAIRLRNMPRSDGCADTLCAEPSVQVLDPALFAFRDAPFVVELPRSGPKDDDRHRLLAGTRGELLG